MDFSKAVIQREIWGTKPCRHPTIEAEFFMGQNTGKTVCTICGALFLTGLPPKPRQRNRQVRLADGMVNRPYWISREASRAKRGR